MRIAVCLAGQPRTWKMCYGNIKKTFEVPGVSVDYFIHTWSENGSDYRGYPHENLSQDKLRQGLEEAYCPKVLKIESYTKLGLQRWYSHRHSVCTSLKLRQTWEETHGFTYDWVFYSRLDFCRFRTINVPLLELEAVKNVGADHAILYGSDRIHWSPDMSYHMQDYAWFGSSNDMNLFSCLEQDFYAAEKIHKECPDIFREYCAEDFFAFFAVNRCIEVRELEPFWDYGAPVRQSLEKFNIDLNTEEGLDTYLKILDKYGWYYTEKQLCEFFNVTYSKKTALFV